MDSQMQIVARHLKAAPVDLSAICNDLGISFLEKKLEPGQSGWIERLGDKYIIVVNADEPEVRQRFTAAHELGHYLLHRDLMEDGSRMNRHTDSLFDGRSEDEDSIFRPYHETQANKMAAQIVMPAILVRRLHREGGTSASIAEELLVSRAAMDIRFKTLGLSDEF